MQSDAELIEQVRQGNTEAYDVLVRRYERLVRAVALHVNRDRHAAEDTAPETFLSAFQSLSSLRRAESFGPWLLSIARHKATGSIRSRPVGECNLRTDEPAGPQTNGQLTEPSKHLLALVQRLSDHERVVIALRHFEGHSVQDIADITGRPVGTITKQLSRAHKRLKKWIKPEMM